MAPGSENALCEIDLQETLCFQLEGEHECALHSGTCEDVTQRNTVGREPEKLTVSANQNDTARASYARAPSTSHRTQRFRLQ